MTKEPEEISSPAFTDLGTSEFPSCDSIHDYQTTRFEDSRLTSIDSAGSGVSLSHPTEDTQHNNANPLSNIVSLPDGSIYASLDEVQEPNSQI